VASRPVEEDGTVEDLHKLEIRSAALPSVSQFRRVIPFVRPHVGKLLAVFLLSILSSLLGLSYPMGAKFLVDNALAARNERLLIILALALAMLVVLGFLLGAVTRYVYTGVSARILMGMRVFLFRHLQTLSPRFYAGTKTGEIVSRLSSDVAEIQSLSTDALFSLALSVLTLVGTIGLLLYLDWRLFLLCTFFLPLGTRFLVRYRQRIAAQARRVRESNAELSSTLLESLQGMKWIKTVGAEQTEAAKLTEKNEQYIASLLRYQVVSAYANALPSSFLSLSALLLLLYGGHRVIAGQMSLGSLVAFAAYQGRVLSPMQNIIGLYLSLQRARVSLDRVLEFLNLQPEVREKTDAIRLSPSRGEIELRDVCFAYHAGQPVLQHINLRVSSGSQVAIVGPSGAGKSTLVDLLLRFYDPQQGAVLLDGHDIRNLQVSSLRESMAVISAEPFLFHASIEENIRYANWQATPEQVWSAVRMADLEEFVLSLPEGINSVVGERGLKLSTGQRQRLAIARAALRNAQIWIFDEATGSLDLLTESRIWVSLEEWLAERTTLIISHRLSSVRHAGSIVVLDHGEIVQQGSHELLVKQEGLYRRLYHAASAQAHPSLVESALI
jgi:ATP-binding cassette, subfamily B, bacterial